MLLEQLSILGSMLIAACFHRNGRAAEHPVRRIATTTLQQNRNWQRGAQPFDKIPPMPIGPSSGNIAELLRSAGYGADFNAVEKRPVTVRNVPKAVLPSQDQHARTKMKRSSLASRVIRCGRFDRDQPVHFDIVHAADLGDPGEASSSLRPEMKAARRLGLRVAVIPSLGPVATLFARLTGGRLLCSDWVSHGFRRTGGHLRYSFCQQPAGFHAYAGICRQNTFQAPDLHRPASAIRRKLQAAVRSRTR